MQTIPLKGDALRRCGSQAAALATVWKTAARAATAAGISVLIPLAAGQPVADPIQMSPFEVNSGANRGYFAPNTMSGTRLASKVEDLGASITVITKEQMQDFALLDLNDLFSYEASTEGKGNYTDFSFDRNGNPVDNTLQSPTTANRIRGIGAANVTFDGFETSGRVPIDPINLDAVELTRGPNSSLFGIGSGAGTVNTIGATANVSRDRSQVTGRVDNFGGYRSTLDLNRVLRRDVLAVRGSAVFQHDDSMRKPTGTDTVRLNGMLRFQPFKNTTIRAAYNYYHIYGNRPNVITPLEVISGWQAAGSPTWDPITASARVNGVTTTYGGSTPVFFTPGNFRLYSNLFVDQGGIQYWSTGGGTTSLTTPSTVNQNQRLMQPVNDSLGDLANLPLFQKSRPISSKAMYDWSSLNFSAINRFEEINKIASVLLEQSLLTTADNRLALQLGWFRETDYNNAFTVVGRAPSQNTTTNVLAVDVNERRIDGTPNPFFLRPYYLVASPQTILRPLQRDTYRAQLAYSLDLTRENGWRRWLGAHQLVGYGEFKNVITRNITYRDVIADAHPWLPAGTQRAADGNNGTAFAQGNYWLYVGGRGSNRVEYAPPGWAPGQYTFNWGNAATGAIFHEPVQLAPGVGINTAGGSNSWTELKARGAILQSHFWQDRIVTTFGYRYDQRYTRNGVPLAIAADGISLKSDFNAWAPGDWNLGEGPTHTEGVVVRPLRWLTAYVNRSQSFQPASPAQTLYLAPLSDPRGRGHDYGLWFNLLDNRLSLRIGHYKTENLQVRDSTSTTIATRVLAVDRPNFLDQNPSPTAYQLYPLAVKWVSNAAAASGRSLTPDELNTRVAAIMGLDPKFLAPVTVPVAGTDDMIARGTEIELNYNPSAFWTLKLNLAQQESVNQNLGSEVARWVNERVQAWSKIIDPELNVPWFTNRYGGTSSAADNLAVNVTAPLALALANDGKSQPQIRKYRVNTSTSFRLAGVTDNRWLKRVTVGGAVRWEDKGAIGYYALAGSTTAYDPNRPVYDKAHTYLDAFASYSTKLFRDKVGARFQLNVRNLNESGRLQPISVQPDGTPSMYRIIDPRQFILSASFDL